MKKELSKGLKRFYGIGDLCFTLMSQVQDVFFNFFLTNIALFSLGTTTLITTITTVVDAAFSWIYGAIINGTKPMRWGRYRSWLVVFTWIVPFIYTFKFIKVGEGILPIIIIIAAGIISSFIWNFPYVANMSIIPVVGKTPSARMQLSSTRAVYSRASSILFSYMGLPLADFLSNFVGESYKFGALAFVLGILMVIGYFIHFKLTEGYEEPLYDDTPSSVPSSKKKTRTSGKSMLKGLFQNGPLLSLIVAEMTRWVANFVILGCAIYYFQYVAGDSSMLTTYLLIANIFCMIGAFASKYFAKKMSSKFLFFSSFILMGGMLSIARLFYNMPWIVIILMAIAQFGFGCIYSTSPAMFADTAILAEWKTGEDSSAWIMGLGNVPLKIALVLRGLIINGIFAIIGFSATETGQVSTTLKVGISNIFLLIPGVAVLIGGVIILFGFKLTKQQIEEMSKDIESRRLN
ncbi:MAG: MFS transporter [Eubacterium sp.]|nr:MFS transporter [Eubacterium sp.]